MTKYFFAIMSPAEAENDLLRLQCRIRNATLVPKLNLHVTLAFIGAPKGLLPREELTEVGNDLMTLAPRMHVLTLGQVEYWARARCLVLTPVDGAPPALSQLHHDLYSMLGKHGFSKVSDYPTFRPHVTLAKAVTKAPAQSITKVPPVKMPVFDFALVESTGGGTYNVVKRWDLNP